MSLRLTPYLIMSGNAKEAIQFYEKTLGAKVLQYQTYGDLPAFPDDLSDCVAYALLKIGETQLMISDSPGPAISVGNQVTICISTSQREETTRIFEALKQDGVVNNALEKTPFSPAFGNVTDKYGITFTLITDGEQQQ